MQVINVSLDFMRVGAQFCTTSSMNTYFCLAGGTAESFPPGFIDTFL